MIIWQLDYFFKALESKGWQVTLSEQEYDPGIPSIIEIQRSSKQPPLLLHCIGHAIPVDTIRGYSYYVRGHYRNLRIDFYIPAKRTKYKDDWVQEVDRFLQELDKVPPCPS